MAIRILVADDNVLIREEICSLLNNDPGFMVIGEAGDNKGMVYLVNSLLPDVIIMDFHLPGNGGIETIRRLKAQNPVIKLIVLSMYSSFDFIEGVMKEGVSGFVLKDIIFEELLHAVSVVTENGTYISKNPRFES